MANKTPEEILEKNRKYRKSKHGREVVRKIQLRLRTNLRESLLSLLGGICVHCGFKDKRALQIDHINGGGHIERKVLSSVWKYYKAIQESFLKGEGKYQLLCANCNVIKRIVNREVIKP